MVTTPFDEHEQSRLHREKTPDFLFNTERLIGINTRRIFLQLIEPMKFLKFTYRIISRKR